MQPEQLEPLTTEELAVVRRCRGVLDYRTGCIVMSGDPDDVQAVAEICKKKCVPVFYSLPLGGGIDAIASIIPRGHACNPDRSVESR